ncbi:hypothetical protein IDM40_21375 [Nocardiopsis sp. HNM0947]|uniref:PQQ-like domain-containing protein n=1 Tax=Nocardiopsis coralli TaxID=2772213 RepID=A0ABR9PBN3_9ACTN|nr:hypothetical protein [Nocardiopsis coralli]MBE3001224.1 hypothetical protein [Nocardiopsis coralli]
MRAAVAWVGLGLIAGALVWAVVTLALYAGYEGTGVEEDALVAAMMSFLLGLVVLGFGAKWRADALYPDFDPDLRGIGCVVPVLIIGAGAVVLVQRAHPENTEGLAAAAPVQVHVWLITVVVLLGVLLIAPLAGRPSAEPLARTFPAFTAGVMVVALAGTLVHTVLYPAVRHSTADEPGQPAAVPDTVTRVGWTWEPGPGVRLSRIEEGTHGPLMVLTDGVVALDGTDGSELWSFRRPYDRDMGVSVDGDRVIVTHVPADRSAGGDPEERVDGSAEESTDTGPGAQAEVLDAATGENVPGLEEIPHPSRDDLTGHHVARTVDQVFRAEAGDEVEDATVLSAVDAATGEESWSAPVPAGGGRVCEGGLPELHHGLLISTHVCEDEEAFEGNTIGWREDPDVAPEVEHVVQAVDPDTGERVWERTWDAVGDQSAWRITPAGPVSEGADPVLLVEAFGSRAGVVLDPATGEDAITLRTDLEDTDTDAYFDGFLGADSESATYLVRVPGRHFVERVGPEGEQTETIDARDVPLVEADGGTVLEGSVLTLRFEDADGEVGSIVHPGEFGGRMEYDTDEQIRLGDKDDVLNSGSELLPMPGAVVVEVGEEGTVHGLVP